MTKFILLITSVISLNALAHVGGPKLPPKPGPAGKQTIYCDFNTENYKLFIDLYFKFDAKTASYTEMEVGVFQNEPEQLYPQYLWSYNIAPFFKSGLIAYTIYNDPKGILTFMLNGNQNGVFLPKNKGVIQDFYARVHGQMYYPSHAQSINNDFLCYDPSTKARSLR